MKCEVCVRRAASSRLRNCDMRGGAFSSAGDREGSLVGLLANETNVLCDDCYILAQALAWEVSKHMAVRGQGAPQPSLL